MAIPSKMEGVMILNLPSYAGGNNLWGEPEEIDPSEGVPYEIFTNSSLLDQLTMESSKLLELRVVSTWFCCRN